jgi:hypothetical protein
MNPVLKASCEALAILSLVQAAPAWSQRATDACLALDGATIVTEEGKYLGRVANKYNSDSIFNRYGTYGSRYSSESVWNDYGSFGSKYSNTSARSQYASSPPLLIKDRQIIGRLTTNQYLSGAINPTTLGIVCYDYEPD